MNKLVPGTDARKEALTQLDKELRKIERALAAARRKETRSGADPELAREIQRLQGELIKMRLARKAIEERRETPEDYLGGQQ